MDNPFIPRPHPFAEDGWLHSLASAVSMVCFVGFVSMVAGALNDGAKHSAKVQAPRFVVAEARQ